jgi:uncharacterized glyoxalase superfamily metalloenzyme YdcJ
VAALLTAHQQAGRFIQTPVLKKALDWINDSEEQLSAGERIAHTRQSADKEIRLGTKMATKAQKINPHSGEMMALRGVFSFLQARSVSDESECKELLQKAHSLLQDALKVNANVTHAFAPYLKEVDQRQSKLNQNGTGV